MIPVEAISGLLPRLTRTRVAVVGDLMLDRYVYGEATRISQEAPVPVVLVRDGQETPGGAANVLRNVTGLGAQALAFGVVGDDAEGSRLVDLLNADGVDTAGVVRVPQRPTTVKTRVLAGNQQVCRIDREVSAPVSNDVVEAVSGALGKALNEGAIDGVIIEDYAKGLLDPELVRRIVRLSAGAGVPIGLDPHPANAFDVPGLTFMTPNRSEAFGLVGAYPRPPAENVLEDEPLLDVGRRLLERWQMEMLLITLGPHGMLLFAGSEAPTHIPTRAREVFDVSGAGDTVMASFMLALLAGAAPVHAAHFANIAAGIVVAKVGTAAVTVAEIEHELQRIAGGNE